MKKSIAIFAFLMLGLASISYAGTGNARDGYLFAAFVIGILIAIGGIFFSVDFLKKNGKRIRDKIMAIWHMLTHRHEHSSGNSTPERFEITIS